MTRNDALFHTQTDFQTITIRDIPGTGRCLFLDGVMQSCDSDHIVYDEALLRNAPFAMTNLLILGGGDGFVASSATRRNSRMDITVVDVDKALVQACKDFFPSEAFESSRVRWVFDDAIHFLRGCRQDFDHIICDLTDTPVLQVSKFASSCIYHFELLRLVSQRLANCGAISLYAGCDKSFGEVLHRSQHLKNCVTEAVNVPSYGEPCYVLHAHIVH